MIHVAYDQKLLDWRLGKGHPTNPIRAKRATELLMRRMPHEVQVDPITRKVSDAELAIVHDPAYVKRTMAGYNDEWGTGKKPALAKVARHMFAGTAQLVDELLEGSLTYGFAPQGAKHHAMFDYGSGFCVFNDFAYAALRLAEAGHRVLYVDTDAHHGDGVEALTRHEQNVMTVSVHDSTIFPGTGNDSDLVNCVFNYPLVKGAGDRELNRSIADALLMADVFDPTVVLFAIGGDGYKDDPLSTLEYTYGGYAGVASAIGTFVGLRNLPILMGGAGGYLPLTHTPQVWALVVEGVHIMAEKTRNGSVYNVAKV